MTTSAAPRGQLPYIVDDGETIGDSALAVFPYAESGVGGCLMAGPGTPTPSVNGTLVYMAIYMVMTLGTFACI